MLKNVFHVTVLFVAVFLVSSASANEDWPMWRGNPSRSGAVDNALPKEFNPLWSVNLGARKQAWDDPLNLDLMTYDRVFEPIVYQGLLCVGFNDQDKLMAIDVKTGETRWTYYAEGPVRLPPVGYGGNIYFCSDDGFLYCVRASSGELLWKFCGSPNPQKAIGNHRITSAWPARGGPVVYDKKVYFAASIWPFMGTFIYALDAETGEVHWMNDKTGSQYIKQPHSAPSFAGVAPQGALVATEKYLIVPGGRSVPAVFDRLTGELKYFEINAGGKGTGGSFVSADALHYYVHTRHKGTRAFNLKSGQKTAFTPNEPVLANGFLYSAETKDKKDFIRAYVARDEKKKARKPIWQVSATGTNDLILVGNTVVAADKRSINLIHLRTDKRKRPKKVQTKEVTGLRDGEEIVRLLVADKKLFVVGSKGTICALGVAAGKSGASQERNLATKKTVAEKTPKRRPSKRAAAIAKSLTELGDAEGYAFWFGKADSPKLGALIQSTPFVQLAVVDHDEKRIQKLRRYLDRRQLLGRVSAHVATPQDFRAPKYVAHMVFATREAFRGDESLAAIYESVRPYGGTLVLVDDAGIEETDQRRVENLQLEQAKVQLQELSSSATSSEQALVINRAGPLPGAADWTHQYGDIANTVKSDDQRVKLPLGILWFGGSSNMDVLPRHGHGPPEQVVGGRLFIEGMNCLSARDVYTGRVLWKRKFDDLGTFDVYFDATFEDVPLDPKYNQVHIPGANGRGTNYVVTEDRVYLIIGASCLMLDPATGESLGEIKLPKNEDGSRPEWGFLGVYEDTLLGGVGFANYLKRHDLKFEADKELKKNKAGFATKSFDRAASRELIGFDRHSGKQRWRVKANHSFWHNGIVAGGGRIYCLDKNPTKIEQAMRRRGLALPDSYRILAINAIDGAKDWEIKEGIFGTWLGYSEKHNLLLQAGAKASDRLSAEVGQGMCVYLAASGKLHWNKEKLSYTGPCILHNDLIITNANSYSESAGAFYIENGRQKLVRHPLTGEEIPWMMTRAYGCNNIIASENMLTFRSGAAGYYDLTTDSGTGNLGGFKSGCTSNLVVANGVLNAPDYTRSCSCSYQNQTSLALIHMPEIEVWSVNALATTEQEIEKALKNNLLKTVGINLGAAGDRRDENGTLWLEFPAKAGDSPPFTVKYNSDARVYAQHSASRQGDPRAWITSSGIDNLKQLSIKLNLTEELDLKRGIPVMHVDDDAEESETGEIDLASSDLELTEDGGLQTVGIRFAHVPLAQGCRIRKAYLQFTCDEPSDVETSLSLAGELSAAPDRFAKSSHDITSRTRTASDVSWSPPEWKKAGDSGSAQRTSDVSSIVREVVELADWKAGNPMAFMISGSGLRHATSRSPKNKAETKLVVITESNSIVEEPETTEDYDIELVFAAPRLASTQSAEPRVFDVFIGDRCVAEKVTVEPYSQASPMDSAVISLPRVAIGKKLDLRFEAKQGTPVLCGIRLSKCE